MKNCVTTVILIILVLTAGNAFSQIPDSTSRGGPGDNPPEEKPLPEIQLKEYTIIGLAKVTLPHKMRRQIFKEVSLNWIKNSAIDGKELPSIAFRFSRVKPSLMQLYEFPWLDSRVYYGSFNTAGIGIKNQFKIHEFMPYFSADYERSDGHTDNAQHDLSGLKAGFHYGLGEDQILHLGTVFQNAKRGIWADRDKLGLDWEETSTLWQFIGELDQKFNRNSGLRWTGQYFLDDQENAVQQSERGFDAAGNLFFQMGNTRVEAGGEYKNSEITTDPGNCITSSIDSFLFEKYDASILTGSFFLQQRIGNLTARAGLLYQKVDEEVRFQRPEKFEDTYSSPQVSLSLGIQDWGAITLVYRPGAELNRLGNMFRELPFSNLGNVRTVNYKSRFQSELDFRLETRLELSLQGTIATIENYMAPLDSVSNLKSGSYPGWLYGTVDEVSLNEMTARLRWKIVPELSATGWLTLYQSEIKKWPVGGQITGNEIPYLPAFNLNSEIKWDFYRKHQVEIGLEFHGKRYGDPANRIRLDDYLLLSARLDLWLSQHIRFFVQGNNLTDTEYDLWHRFPAAGINGILGIRVVI